MSKLRVGRHARVGGAPVNAFDDDFRGRIMVVEHITDDGHVRLYDISTPMVRGIQSLPLFEAADVEPLD